MIFDTLIQLYTITMAFIGTLFDKFFLLFPLQPALNLLPDTLNAFGEFFSYISFLSPLIPIPLIFTLLGIVIVFEIAVLIIKMVITFKTSLLF